MALTEIVVNIRGLPNDPSRRLSIVDRVSKSLKAAGHVEVVSDYEKQANAVDDLESLLKLTRQYVNTIEF